MTNREFAEYEYKRRKLLMGGDTLAALWKRGTEKSENMTAQTSLFREAAE